MNKKSYFVALLLLCFSNGLLAQAVAGFGGISGVVRDATGAVVPSASVIVENSSKGIRRTLTSNEQDSSPPRPSYPLRATRFTSIRPASRPLK